MEINTGEKPVASPECINLFPQKWDLKIDIKLLAGEKPYI